MFLFAVFFVLLSMLDLGKSGFLSRTGVCPHPSANYVVKDTRLNFYGLSYILPGDENPPCNERGCVYDNDCHSDMRCCTNHCGAYVCTGTVREPHPCQYFTCPITKICKIQKIKCIEPICPDMLTIARPMCVNGGPYYEFTKRARISHPLPPPQPAPEFPMNQQESLPVSYRSYIPDDQTSSWNPQYNWYNRLMSWANYFNKNK